MPRCTEGEENTKALAQRIETVHSELLKWVNTTTRMWLSPCVGEEDANTVSSNHLKKFDRNILRSYILSIFGGDCLRTKVDAIPSSVLTDLILPS